MSFQLVQHKFIDFIERVESVFKTRSDNRFIKSELHRHLKFYDLLMVSYSKKKMDHKLLSGFQRKLLKNKIKSGVMKFFRLILFTHQNISISMLSIRTCT